MGKFKEMQMLEDEKLAEDEFYLISPVTLIEENYLLMQRGCLLPPVSNLDDHAEHLQSHINLMRSISDPLELSKVKYRILSHIKEHERAILNMWTDELVEEEDDQDVHPNQAWIDADAWNSTNASAPSGTVVAGSGGDNDPIVGFDPGFTLPEGFEFTGFGGDQPSHGGYPDVEPEKKCTCGSEATFGANGTHSTWCDKS